MSDGPKGFRFDLTITLGNVLSFIGVVALAIAAWVHFSDRMSNLEEARDQSTRAMQRITEIVQEMQVTQATQTVIIQSMERRLGIVEDVQGLDGRKR